MPRTSFYSVHFIANDGSDGVRIFSTIRAARNYFRRSSSLAYVKSVSLYRGQAGGELLDRVTA